MVDQPNLLQPETSANTAEQEVSSVSESFETAQTPVEEVSVPEGMPEVSEVGFEKVEAEPPKAELTPEQKATEQEALALAEEIAPVVQEEPIIPKDPILVDIEGILSKGLDGIYSNLPDDKKPLFKEKGEAVAVAVKEMIQSGKTKATKLFEMIREWLKLIPGVNRYFLEQEAKIKTDHLLDYVDAAKASPTQNQI